ncbi:MAG: hypothetical protein IJZ63_05855 [Clostridia bacterium]|nr:hypothetical protein [Clostridia bacterium]
MKEKLLTHKKHTLIGAICLVAMLIEKRGYPINALAVYTAAFGCMLVACKGKLNLVNVLKLVLMTFVAMPIVNGIYNVLVKVCYAAIENTVGVIISSLFVIIQSVGFVAVLFLAHRWVTKNKTSINKTDYIVLSALTLVSVVCSAVGNYIVTLAMADLGETNTLFGYLEILTASDNFYTQTANILLYATIFYVAVKLIGNFKPEIEQE